MNIVDYSTIFTEPEENNCFSRIAQAIITEIAFSFIIFVSSSKTSRSRAVAILENKCLSTYYNHLARGDYSEI